MVGHLCSPDGKRSFWSTWQMEASAKNVGEDLKIPYLGSGIFCTWDLFQKNADCKVHKSEALCQPCWLPGCFGSPGRVRCLRPFSGQGWCEVNESRWSMHVNAQGLFWWLLISFHIFPQNMQTNLESWFPLCLTGTDDSTASSSHIRQ